jgi:hypothetical protein
MSAGADQFNDEFWAASDWAKAYREMGLQIVPAFSPSGVAKGKSWKRPLFQQWTEFQEVLVPDAVFDRWYGPGGEYVAHLNMGVICGRASGNLMVIDLDIHKTPIAAQWWEGLLAIHNNHMSLETAEQRTGGGGRQKLFRTPAGFECPTNRTPDGVDIRGQGGFAMLAPSIHETGAHYAWLEGCAPWDEAGIARAPQWLLEAVLALVGKYGSGTSRIKGHSGYRGGDFDGFGHRIDGREEKMRDLVWAAVVDWRRDCLILPGDGEQRLKAAEKYLIYEGLVEPQKPHPVHFTKTDKLEAEGRGPTEFWKKWQAAMAQWDGDVAAAAREPSTGTGSSKYKDYSDEFAKAADAAEAQAKANPANLYEYLDIDQIMAMPDPVWLIDELVNEKSLGFIFGPPGSLKTFIAIDIALSTAANLSQWWDRKINQHGAAIYLCREGTRSLKFRIGAWELHRKTSARGRPFYLIEKTINFMRGEDVGILLATVDDIMVKAGVSIAAIFVDTVSRVLPGAKENQQEDMSLFISACEALQQRFNCVVIGVHHVNKTGSIRGSTVIPGAGDFLIETRREPGAMVGSIVVQKVKDGEDGKEFPFKVTKVELGGIVPRSSLMVDPDADPGRVEVKGDDLPDISVCREILSALAMAWFNKMPWGSADNSARPAVRLIMARWSLKRAAVKRLLDGWMANGIIEYPIYDHKNKLSGYRKVIDL